MRYVGIVKVLEFIGLGELIFGREVFNFGFVLIGVKDEVEVFEKVKVFVVKFVEKSL